MNNNNQKSPYPQQQNLKQPFTPPQQNQQMQFGNQNFPPQQNQYTQPQMGFNNFSNPPNYQNPNFYNQQGYGFQPYGLAQNIIMHYADQIFMKHDQNMSGYIDVKEIYPAVQEIFVSNNMQPPQYQHVLQIMQSFDIDQNGLLDMDQLNFSKNFRNCFLYLLEKGLRKVWVNIFFEDLKHQTDQYLQMLYYQYFQRILGNHPVLSK